MGMMGFVLIIIIRVSHTCFFTFEIFELYVNIFSMDVLRDLYRLLDSHFPLLVFHLNSPPCRWGIGVMLGILVSGGVSGGHLNPAITVAVASIGKFPWKKVSHDDHDLHEHDIHLHLILTLRLQCSHIHVIFRCHTISEVSTWGPF